MGSRGSFGFRRKISVSATKISSSRRTQGDRGHTAPDAAKPGAAPRHPAPLRSPVMATARAIWWERRRRFRCGASAQTLLERVELAGQLGRQLLAELRVELADRLDLALPLGRVDPEQLREVLRRDVEPV